MAASRRVVVTGMGIISPLGNELEATWQNILAGKSGAKTVTAFDVTEYPTKFAAPVENFDDVNHLDVKTKRRVDEFVQYGLVASKHAIENSGLELNSIDSSRIGVSIGSGIGGLDTIEKNALTLDKRGPRKISPFFVPGAIVNMVSGLVSIEYGLHGPNLSIVTACSSGNHSIGFSARSISHGDCDVMITGGSEMAITPLGLGGFSAVTALSTNNENPTKASRPWDKDRDGFVLGDGAGVLVLEEYEHAKARSANIFAEVTGFGMSSDAFHMTAPAEDGKGAKQAMISALKDADLDSSKIDYINAHGTSTPLGDIIEANAIADIFSTSQEQIAVSSTKSMTGHLLGAAGAIESIFSILSLRDNRLPPTINLDNLDGDAPKLNYVANESQEKEINYVLNNSFGFGGTNASLVFSKI
nr:MAG: 3-oxoacyl-[acyl-carrier-protein] synthase 2 [Gammaproteobacteria bacterium]